MIVFPASDNYSRRDREMNTEIYEIMNTSYEVYLNMDIYTSSEVITSENDKGCEIDSFTNSAGWTMGIYEDMTSTIEDPRIIVRVDDKYHRVHVNHVNISDAAYFEMKALMHFMIADKWEAVFTLNCATEGMTLQPYDRMNFHEIFSHAVEKLTSEIAAKRIPDENLQLIRDTLLNIVLEEKCSERAA